jgi:hypothetical protein
MHAGHELRCVQVAVVAFSTVNGTARSRITTSPWTASADVLDKWQQTLPSLQEGVGFVAAFEALGSALALLEQPSEFTPAVALQSGFASEILMLWLSESVPDADMPMRHPDKPPLPGHVCSCLGTLFR